MAKDWKQPTDNIYPLLDTILEYFPPAKIEEGNTQMLITSLDYSSFIGRIAIGRLKRGTLKPNQQIMLAKRDGTMEKHRIKEVFVFDGIEKRKVDEIQPGDICAVTGIEGFEIGDCICDLETPEPLKSIAIDEPTMSMLFTINDSPFYGKEGKYVTSRHIHDRLEKELEKNLALKVAPTASADKWMVYGRGVMHLSVLLETMRREGYEVQVGQPQVIFKDIDGVKCEPIEDLTIDLPESFSGTAIDVVTKRKGEMISMEPKGERMICKFKIPSRGIIGLRTFLLTQTGGEAVVTHRYIGYEPYKGDIPGRMNGSLISMENGNSIPFSLNNLQDRGMFFIEANMPIYEGQVIGQHTKANDLVVNVTKTKQLTNMRKSGTDAKVKIAPPKLFSLEEALEYIQEDEYVELTPESIRIRKIYLKEHERKRSGK
jgi:GTP-binding protein